MRNLKPPSRKNICLTPKARGPNFTRLKTRQQKEKKKKKGNLGVGPYLGEA